MSTFNDRGRVEQIIAMNGDTYPDDPHEPKVIRIVEYTNAWGNQCWGVVFETDRDPLRYDRPSSYVINPAVIFERR